MSLVFSCAQGEIVLTLPNATEVKLFAPPIKYEGNSLAFAPVVAEFGGSPVGAPRACFGCVLWVPFRGWRAPYTETILEEYVKLYRPAAFIIYHAEDDGALQPGGCFQNGPTPEQANSPVATTQDFSAGSLMLLTVAQPHQESPARLWKSTRPNTDSSKT